MFSQQKTVVKPNPKQAIVVAVEGQAVLKSHLTKREEPLRANKPLFMGDAVRCVSGTLTLSEYGNVVRIKPSPTWHTIYPPPNPAYKKFVVPLMGRLGVPASETVPSFFEVPLPGSAVIPDRFQLRWQPGELQKITTRPVQVRVRMGNTLIWPNATVSAVLPTDKGEWTPPELADRLARLQGQGKLTDFELQWTDAPAFPPSLKLPTMRTLQATGKVAFSLLSVQKQKEVGDALVGLGKNFGPLEQALYRIAWLDNNHLFAEAADAYETAARLAPSRLDLKGAALEFLRAHGLETRARQLELDLPR